MAGNNKYEYKQERRGKRDVDGQELLRTRASADRDIRRGRYGLRVNGALRHGRREPRVKWWCQPLREICAH